MLNWPVFFSRMIIRYAAIQNSENILILTTVTVTKHPVHLPFAFVSVITTLKHPLHQSLFLITVITILKHLTPVLHFHIHHYHAKTFLTPVPHPHHCHQHLKNPLPFTLSPGGTLELIRYPQSPWWSCLYQRGEVCVGKGRPGVPLLVCVWPSPASGSGSVIFQG
ncbi:hypothetical protein E2C01_068649 [Portunus trituberculatus]|uniref:Uncharacterized protein n=1 Tax=Portunus trituberculatus TaxID=210409 RepID=A0A5B7HSJ3_PORTR|nr:hypothetical protein [Portunus trituberculatus]